MRSCARPSLRSTTRSMRAAGSCSRPGTLGKRPWQRWDGMSFTETNPEDGGVVTVTYKILDVTGDVVKTSETMTGQWWDEPQVGRGPCGSLTRARSPCSLTKPASPSRNSTATGEGPDHRNQRRDHNGRGASGKIGVGGRPFFRYGSNHQLST